MFHSVELKLSQINQTSEMGIREIKKVQEKSIKNLTMAQTELRLMTNDILLKLQNKTNQIDVENMIKHLESSFEQLQDINILNAIVSYNETLQDQIKIQGSNSKAKNNTQEMKRLKAVILLLKKYLGYEFVQGVGFVRIGDVGLINKYL